MAEPAHHGYWPFFGLRIHTPRLELRYADDGLLAELAMVHAAGVVVPGSEPFDGDVTFYDPGRGTTNWLRGQWSARAQTSPEWWHLAFAMVVDAGVVGGQEMTGVEFDKVRTVGTFSRLGRTFQGQGLGKEMRSAVLHLAFAGLGAERAESEAFDDNPTSQRVSLALGYEVNGSLWLPRPSGGAPATRFVLTRDRWARDRRDDLVVEGLEPCWPLLGLGPPPD